MKNIYLILTYTGTPLSKIIRSCTKDEFSHVSIALDRELNEMFSFGRTQLYNPLSGGIVVCIKDLIIQKQKYILLK